MSPDFPAPRHVALCKLLWPSVFARALCASCSAEVCASLSASAPCKFFAQVAVLHGNSRRVLLLYGDVVQNRGNALRVLLFVLLNTVFQRTWRDDCKSKPARAIRPARCQNRIKFNCSLSPALMKGEARKQNTPASHHEHFTPFTALLAIWLGLSWGGLLT